MARILKDYPSVSLKPEDLDGQIDVLKIFGRHAPLQIEVGSGKGTFVLNQARARPDLNFLAIERARKYYRYAVDRIGRWGLTNVRIIRIDAAQFLAESVPDNCVDCFHIYFPDPWPKRRHHRRRFFNARNLEQLIRCLKSTGQIKIATDHAVYFEEIQMLLSAYSARLEKTDFLTAAGADTGEWVGTNFERKYLKENRPIYTTAVRKIQ
ncbi:MAG: tRNA (guanosine(46)-N7)-methyltransferase TrmB [Planctomycetota bacterium]|nr:MAG: tRNA (guanosine(46)-N7)-methyltransferase TrmB [Planctomycetota bacterium]